jgi:hypothetical protein
MQVDAGLFLQIADDAEEIAGLRIAARAEHAYETLRLCAGRSRAGCRRRGLPLGLGPHP